MNIPLADLLKKGKEMYCNDSGSYDNALVGLIAEVSGMKYYAVRDILSGKEENK